MIRLVYALRRSPQMSREEFQDYWLHNHAPLVMEYAEVLDIQGYVQFHTIEHPFNEMLQSMRNTMEPYDGVAALWWEDRDKMLAASLSAEGRKAAVKLIEDERRFIDFARSSLWLAKDHVIIAGNPEEIAAQKREGPIVKQTWVGHPLPRLSRKEFQDHYLNNHAPLVKRHAEALGIKRYVQVHTLADPLNDNLQASRETMESYGVNAEFIWDLDVMINGMSTREVQTALQEIERDEQRFIDFSRSAIWMAKEHIIKET